MPSGTLRAAAPLHGTLMECTVGGGSPGRVGGTTCEGEQHARDPTSGPHAPLYIVYCPQPCH